MTIEVDARGFGCPKPVILTKNAIEKASGAPVLTIVDNEIAVKNVERMASNLNYNTTVEEKNGDFYIHIFNQDGCCADANAEGNAADESEWLLLITNDKLGGGVDELGEILMKGYFYALTESKPYPKAILFMNKGVTLSVEDSPVLEYIEFLERSGVEILVCGTCLDFYNLKSKLRVGNVSNMYTIVEKMNKASKVINF